jgi:hypothetical protein
LSLRKQGTISGIWIPRIKCGAGSASAGMTKSKKLLTILFHVILTKDAKLHTKIVWNLNLEFEVLKFMGSGHTGPRND